MPLEDLFTLLNSQIQAIFQETGLWLDRRLSGYYLKEAVHLNIDPAIRAIVRTEKHLSPRMKVDLRELEDVTPPVDSDNLFISFSADSAGFQGGNAAHFGIHMTRPHSVNDVSSRLANGVFIDGEKIEHTYQMIVYIQDPRGSVHLARTGAVIGLSERSQLVSYLTFESNQGPLSGNQNAPSRLDNADPQVMLYVFLTLATFMSVNQAETPLKWLSDKSAVIG